MEGSKEVVDGRTTEQSLEGLVIVSRRYTHMYK